MPRFVVLLRGVNVGKANRIAMADFRALLESIGYSEVQTLLNSGNAVFSGTGRSATAHARGIAAELLQHVDLSVRVVVKSSSEIRGVVSENTLAPREDEHSRLLVAFSQDRTDIEDLSALLPMLQPLERFAIGSQAAYLLCGGGILESRAASALLGKVGRNLTTRNWATVLKLEKLVRRVA